MNRMSRQPATPSETSAKSQTVIPREVHEQLKLKISDNPFATFSEWSSEADEKAYNEL